MTEQTMRERLARTLYADLAKRTDDGGTHYCMLSEIDASLGCRVQGRISLPHLVDAILSVLTEPTPEMVEALVKSIRMDVLDMGYKDPDEPPQEIWDLLRAAFTAAIRKAGE